MHQIKSTEAIARVRMEARLPVSIRSHGAAAPNPAELRQLDPVCFPLNPQGDFSPPVPQGRRGEVEGPIGSLHARLQTVQHWRDPSSSPGVQS